MIMKGKRCLLRLLVLFMCLCVAVPAAADGLMAGLLSRLSTRTGPGTQYDEPGTYFQKDWQTAQVQVISAAWDHVNDIWWVEVDFSAIGKKFRAYTGLKRVAVDINTVPQEQLLGTTVMTSAAKVYWGPGRDYVEAKYNVPNYTEVKVYGAENGFVQVEFHDPRTAVNQYSLRRGWVTARAVSGQWEVQQPVVTTAPALFPNIPGGSPSGSFQFCPHCGKNLPTGNTYSFCPYCGKAFK